MTRLNYAFRRTNAKPALGVLFLVGFLALFISFCATAKEPVKGQLVWNAEGQTQQFSARFSPIESQLVLGQHSQWLLELRDSKNKAIDNASIAISAGMFGEGHGHGMPAAPAVTEYLGEGVYKIEGVLFNMLGSWTFLFDIEASQVRDRIRIDVNFDHRHL